MNQQTTKMLDQSQFQTPVVLGQMPGVPQYSAQPQSGINFIDTSSYASSAAQQPPKNNG
jgi:hypothetical protein